MKGVYFVSGIDTDIGKTVATGVLAKQLLQQGKSVITQKPVDLDKIRTATQELAAQYEIVLVEGAGGLMVPLTENLLTIDYIQEQAYPVILVTSGRLGSINHTLLSFAVLKQYGIRLHSLVFNHIHDSSDECVAQDSLNYLQCRLKDSFPEAEWLELDKTDTV